MTGRRPPRLTRRFFRRSPVELAIALLGQRLVRIDPAGRRLAGLIVETEAYLGPEDRAAHSYGGRRTERNESMYLDAGHAYVYFTYGMHHCMNIVADGPGRPTAVLLRALEPTEGIEQMTTHRAGKIPADRLRLTDLASGPAKLCQALHIDRSLDGIDLTGSSELFVERGLRVARSRIARGPRIGVDYAGPWAAQPLRFAIADCPHLSRPIPAAESLDGSW